MPLLRQFQLLGLYQCRYRPGELLSRRLRNQVQPLEVHFQLLECIASRGDRSQQTGGERAGLAAAEESQRHGQLECQRVKAAKFTNTTEQKPQPEKTKK